MDRSLSVRTDMGSRPGVVMPSVSIIGSFKQKYEQVLDAWRIFTAEGIEVRSPKGTPIVERGISFVRFESDPEEASDAEVQTIALHRILSADAVFVVAPDGYVGKTTCYEIGRIIQSRRPLYFSEHPDDLPLHVPDSHVIDSATLAQGVLGKGLKLRPLYVDGDSLEAKLLARRRVPGHLEATR